MRLTQLWQRFSVRERALVGGALAVLLLVVIRYGVIEPYLAYTDQLTEQIEQELQRLAKMERQRDRGPEVTAQLARLRQHFHETWARLIPGGTPAIAAAQLQERVRSLVAESGLDLVTTSVLREETLGDFRKVAVQVTLRGELPEVAAFLTRIEYGDWHLVVSTLEVRSAYSLRLPHRASQRPLTITMEVGGVMQGDKTPVPAQES